MAVKSALIEKIPGICHAFGDRDEALPAVVERYWDVAKPFWKQVHGTEVCEVTKPAQSCGDVDALLTYTPGCPIAVVTADCVPIILAKNSGESVAVIHAGWRGTQAGIVAGVWEKLSQKGEKPEDWSASLGPAIRACCYEVGEDLVAKFRNTFPQLSPDLISPAEPMLDLHAINEALIKELGIQEVDVVAECTQCTLLDNGRPKYFSYRREGKGTRQWTVAMIKA